MSQDESQNRRDELRRQMLTTRNHLRPEQVTEMSRLIISRLDQLEPLQRARCIMSFASIKNEIDLREWMDKAAASGHTLLLPRVEANGQLEAVEFTGWDHTISGPFGIREPIGQAYDTLAIDVVLVPGVVFDARGYRLGYGKGYYDRFLPRLRQDAFCCGVCYDFQVVDDVFPHAADIPVNYILTERSAITVN